MDAGRAGAAPPDEEVVGRVMAGDRDAFGLLVERYRPLFARYAAAMCGDADLAADAMQEAFIRAFDGLARCRHPERFGAWFFRILTNQCRNHRDRRKSHASLAAADVTPLTGAADAPVRAAELQDAIERALDRLSGEQREAFVLRHVEGWSYQEMAELLGEREDALRMRVHRARERLQHFLEDEA